MELEFLEGSMDIAGLVELFDTCLSTGVSNNCLKLGVAESRSYLGE